MHIVIQQRKELKTPKGEVYREIERTDTCYFRNVGAPIPRTPQFKYDIRLKDKGKQYHICTITTWDIVGKWAGGTISDSIESHLRKRLMKANNFNKDQYRDSQVKELWKQYQDTEECKAEYCKIDELIYAKFQQIIDSVKEWYRTTEEGIIKAKQDIMREERISEWEREQSQQQKAREEYERKSREQDSKQWSNFFNSKTVSSNLSNEERDIQRELIQAGYKALSKKYHPDLGGEHDKFILLARVKDNLLQDT